MIRPATLADVPRIVELGAAMHAESSYRDDEFVPEVVARTMAALINGAGVVFVAERDGVVVGGMAGGVGPNWFNNDKAGFELGLFILREARHGLTAIRLIRAFCIWCESQGARRLRVGITTGVQVEGTAALYRSLGFTDGGVFLTKEF